MKIVKRFVLPVLFVSCLAVNTYAGELETPGCVPPPPPSHYTVSTSTTDETTGVSCTSGETSSTTSGSSDEFLYDAFMVMLALF